MVCRIKFAIAVVIFLFCASISPVPGQQKPQWMPGQVGLNAGILPSPGFRYANMDINYDAGSYNDFKGKAIPVTGTYNVWAARTTSSSSRNETIDSIVCL